MTSRDWETFRTHHDLSHELVNLIREAPIPQQRSHVDRVLLELNAALSKEDWPVVLRLMAILSRTSYASQGRLALLSVLDCCARIYQIALQRKQCCDDTFQKVLKDVMLLTVVVGSLVETSLTPKQVI